MADEIVADYARIVQLVDRLSESQQNELIVHLLHRQARQRPLTPQEKIRLFDSAKLYHEVAQTPSPRREDWYDDDGR
jgi:hypothetical protein